MSYVKAYPLVLIAVVAARLLSAQTDPQQDLAKAFARERDGRTAQAIVDVQALLNSNSLSALGAGKAGNILGLAYEDEGNFPRAQQAYEQSIRILEKLPSNIRDYAMALDGLGGLYLANGFNVMSASRFQ
jgi:tetratricopeptide (TPR) repeat protein